MGWCLPLDLPACVPACLPACLRACVPGPVRGTARHVWALFTPVRSWCRSLLVRAVPGAAACAAAGRAATGIAWHAPRSVGAHRQDRVCEVLQGGPRRGEIAQSRRGWWRQLPRRPLREDEVKVSSTEILRGHGHAVLGLWCGRTKTEPGNCWLDINDPFAPRNALTFRKCPWVLL